MKWNIVLLVFLVIFSSTSVEGQKKGKNLTAQYTNWVNEALIYRYNFAEDEQPVSFKDWTPNLEKIKKLGFNVVSIGCVQSHYRDSLGSIWIRDFNATDHRLGKVSNLKSLTTSAHDLGLKVIIDWIPDQIAADHQWRVEHSGWFILDSIVINSGLLPNLDFGIPDVQLEMATEMNFWIKNCNIDGFNITATTKFEDYFWRGIIKSIESNKQLLYIGDSSVVGLFSEKMLLRCPALHEMIELTEQREILVESLGGFIESKFQASRNIVLNDLFSISVDEDDPYRHAKLVLAFALKGIPEFSEMFVQVFTTADSIHFNRCLKNMLTLNSKKIPKSKEELVIIRDPDQSTVLILKKTVGNVSNYFMWNFNSAPVRIQANVLAEDDYFTNILDSEPQLFEGIDRSFVVPGFDCLFLTTQ